MGTIYITSNPTLPENGKYGFYSYLTRRVQPDWEFFYEASWSDPFYLKRFKETFESAWNYSEEDRLNAFELILQRFRDETSGRKGVPLSHEYWSNVQSVGKELLVSVEHLLEKAGPTFLQGHSEHIYAVLHGIKTEWIA